MQARHPYTLNNNRNFKNQGTREGFNQKPLLAMDNGECKDSRLPMIQRVNNGYGPTSKQDTYSILSKDQRTLKRADGVCKLEERMNGLKKIPHPLDNQCNH